MGGGLCDNNTAFASLSLKRWNQKQSEVLLINSFSNVQGDTYHVIAGGFPGRLEISHSSPPQNKLCDSNGGSLV